MMALGDGCAAFSFQSVASADTVSLLQIWPTGVSRIIIMVIIIIITTIIIIVIIIIIMSRMTMIRMMITVMMIDPGLLIITALPLLTFTSDDSER